MHTLVGRSGLRYIALRDVRRLHRFRCGRRGIASSELRVAGAYKYCIHVSISDDRAYLSEVPL